MSDQGSPHFSSLEVSLEHKLPSVIAHVAAVHGDKDFIVTEDGRHISFSDFAARVNRLASALMAHGVALGERVAIWAPNSAEWIIAACAIESIGAIMVPINTRFKGPEAAFVLRKTGARFLFTVSSFLGNNYAEMLGYFGGEAPGADATEKLPELQQIIAMDSDNFKIFQKDIVDFEVLSERLDAVTPQSIADILFTSGTTGEPKGAMHNHGQALWVPAIWNEANDLRATDRMAIVNPFFHSFGYRSGWVSALIAGITIFPIAIFDAGALLALIAREKISVLMGPPTIFFALMEHPDFAKHDLSSLRVGHTGAANVPVDLIKAGRDILGFDLFLTSFGQTESTALVTVNRPGDDFETIAKTVGRPLPGVELRIVGSDGNSVADGESGELLVRGPNVMQGYFDEPEQTAKTINPKGWLHTGDVGCIGPDGTLRILDRLKDIVIVGGFNAYPAEIEAMVRQHPAVADVAIISLPDERMGEVCGACVILNEGAHLDLPQLTDWCRERMANYKIPRQLFIVENFPRTPLGKVQKFILRDTLLAQING